MAAISQMTSSIAFYWMKMFEFRLKFHWSVFLPIQLTIFQHWFRYKLGADKAASHYLNRWWFDYWRIYASLGLSELKAPSAHQTARMLYDTCVGYMCKFQTRMKGNRCHMSTSSLWCLSIFFHVKRNVKSWNYWDVLRYESIEMKKNVSLPLHEGHKNMKTLQRIVLPHTLNHEYSLVSHKKDVYCIYFNHHIGFHLTRAIT